MEVSDFSFGASGGLSWCRVGEIARTSVKLIRSVIVSTLGKGASQNVHSQRKKGADEERDNDLQCVQGGVKGSPAGRRGREKSSFSPRPCPKDARLAEAHALCHHGASAHGLSACIA